MMRIGISASFLGTYDQAVVKAIPKVSELGFDYIEIVSKKPRWLDRKSILKTLNEHGIAAYSICAWCDYAYQNLVNPDEYVRETYLRYTKDLLDLAADVGAEVLVTSAGRILEAISREEAYRFGAENLNELGKYASQLNIKLAVEVVSRFATNFINNAEQAKRLLLDVENGKVGITLDTFHMNIEEQDMREAIRTLRPYLFHMHLSDSNRLAPGLGHVNFKEIIESLKEINYRGCLTLEIQSFRDPMKEARSGLKYIAEMVDRNI